MNGHSLLGVKLSEAQAYLVKSCDSVHMVVCDGFNHLLPKSALNENNGLEVNGHGHGQVTNGHSMVKSAPFPRPPPQPPARNSANLNLVAPEQINGHGTASLSSSSASTTSSASSTSSNGHSDTDLPPEPSLSAKPPGYVNGYKINKPIVPLPTTKQLPLSSSNSSNNCNYDNLRNIDSDDSHVTSPDTAPSIPNAHHLNGNGHQNSSSSSRLSTSIHTNGNGHAVSNGNGKMTTSTTTTPASINNQQHQQQHHPASAPITDKNLMKSIINKTINNSAADPKSQSMFTSNESTPVLAVSSQA